MRAPRAVVSVCTTVNFAAESSWAIVVVPSPQDEKAYPVPGSNHVASTFAPIGT